MSNFSFLTSDFRDIAESAARAEGHIASDPRAACFHARFTLEAVVHWIYRHDPALRMQLAFAENDAATLERLRRKAMEIATMLEEKAAIPAVKARLSYLAALQDTAFWKGIDLAALSREATPLPCRGSCAA